MLRVAVYQALKVHRTGDVLAMMTLTGDSSLGRASHCAESHAQRRTPPPRRATVNQIIHLKSWLQFRMSGHAEAKERWCATRVNVHEKCLQLRVLLCCTTRQNSLTIP